MKRHAIERLSELADSMPAVPSDVERILDKLTSSTSSSGRTVKLTSKDRRSLRRRLSQELDRPSPAEPIARRAGMGVGVVMGAYGFLPSPGSLTLVVLGALPIFIAWYRPSCDRAFDRWLRESRSSPSGWTERSY